MSSSFGQSFYGLYRWYIRVFYVLQLFALRVKKPYQCTEQLLDEGMFVFTCDQRGVKKVEKNMRKAHFTIMRALKCTIEMFVCKCSPLLDRRCCTCAGSAVSLTDNITKIFPLLILFIQLLIQTTLQSVTSGTRRVNILKWIRSLIRTCCTFLLKCH